MSGWEQVFHSFIPKEHYISRDTLMAEDEKLSGALIQSIVIAIDDAESRDALAGVTLTNHYNGRMRAQESLYISMKEQPIKPALTERCAMVIEYLDYIAQHFNIGRTIPIIMTFDCASGMYRQMCVARKTDKNYLRWRNVQMYAYTDKQEKEAQLDEVNASIANGILTIVNVDKYSPQYSNKFLVREIKALRTKEDGKIDGTIPNDCTDALQYGAMTVLRNPYALTFPARKKRYDADKSIDIVLEKLLKVIN